MSSALTDAEGEFVINANLGRTLLTATGPDGASATIEITANKREPERVEMRLPKPGMLRGRILLDGQPAPGVTVFALPTDSGPAVLEPHQSDASGRFEIQLPSPGQVSLISIPSRGGACVQTAYPGGEEELVSLSGHSGVLEVRWKAAGGVRPFLRMGRAVVGLELLVMFSPGRGGLSEAGRIVVPNLSCDRYEICLPPEPGQAVTPSCRPVDVLPGGHTVIDFQEDG